VIKPFIQANEKCCYASTYANKTCAEILHHSFAAMTEVGKETGPEPMSHGFDAITEAGGKSCETMR